MTCSKYIDKLLDGAEVKWLPLSEVTRFELPNRYLVKTENFDDTFLTPVLTASKTFIHRYTDETDGICTASKNPVIIFNDGTAEKRWVDFDFKAKSQIMKIISSSDDTRFLLRYVYHWMSTLPSNFTDGNHQAQWKRTYCRKRIPIPCPEDPEKSLAIQTEIVRKLDAFDDLTTQLTAELTARKKQYNYYLKQILTFDEGNVQWKPLGEIATISAGVREINDATDEGKYPFYVLSERSRKIDSYDFDETAIIAGLNGEGTRAFFHFVTGKYGLHRRACRIVAHDLKLNPKFLFYFLKRDSYKFISRTSGWGRATLMKRTWSEKYLIPIPFPDDPTKSMAEQARIIDILDKFDTLTNSISEGLPREIELRRKQYGYYRNMLLKFQKQKKEAGWLIH